MKTFKQYSEAYYNPRKAKEETAAHVKTMKWKRFEAVDTQGFKIHGRWHHKSGDGAYELHQTGEHPNRGYAHKGKKAYWKVFDVKQNKMWPRSYESVDKAKIAVSEYLKNKK